MEREGNSWGPLRWRTTLAFLKVCVHACKGRGFSQYLLHTRRKVCVHTYTHTYTHMHALEGVTGPELMERMRQQVNTSHSVYSLCELCNMQKHARQSMHPFPTRAEHQDNQLPP
jgi:hypothetical protein